MRRFSPRGLLVLLTLCMVTIVSGTEAAHAAQSTLAGAVDDYRNLAYQAIHLRKALGDDVRSVSPSLDYAEQQYLETLQKLDLKRAEIAILFSLSMAKNETDELLEISISTGQIKAEDPAYPAFKSLRKVLLQKVAAAHLNDPAPLSQAVLAKLDAALQEEGYQVGTAAVREGKTADIPIYIAFHWHMHQPVYWPYEDLVTTNNRGVYTFSLLDVMRQRAGPYTSWPLDAILMGMEAGLPHLGAQVSFSGSLIEGLNAMKSIGEFTDWANCYKRGRRFTTACGNPRLDMVAFGYHHPLMPLTGYTDIRKQIQAHRTILLDTFGDGVAYSRGIFPPENAFAEWIIPALVDEDIQWAFVDNIHFNRACEGYPWVKGENLFPPNPAEQVNPEQDDWIALNGLWAPSRVSAWAYRPHYVALRDPDTTEIVTTPEGRKAKMIAVPTARYMGNEDGRGGFGALNYEMVMSQLQAYNTDPNHPLLIVLHHDGDNFGGGSWGYYHDNFSRFVNWIKGQPDRFVPTTVQDYLDMFPPGLDDIIHVEPGSWAGADNGDPEFHKWNGDPDPETGYSPDRNSWGTMTAARNIIFTAASVAGDQAPAVEAAWRYMMVAQTSCYEYWDGTEMWDSHPTRGCNLSVAEAMKALEGDYRDAVPPSIYVPQREPYNPGGFEWTPEPMPKAFTVWTYVYDISGLETVDLQYRRLGENAWSSLPMNGTTIPSQTNPPPAYKADEYSVVIDGEEEVTYLYRVAAADVHGNEALSETMKVTVGAASPEPQQPAWIPARPTKDDIIVIFSERPGYLHWGVNGWKKPSAAYWPDNSVLWTDGIAIETPMAAFPEHDAFQAVLGPFNGEIQAVETVEFVFHYLDGTWGRDMKIKMRVPEEQ